MVTDLYEKNLLCQYVPQLAFDSFVSSLASWIYFYFHLYIFLPTMKKKWSGFQPDSLTSSLSTSSSTSNTWTASLSGLDALLFKSQREKHYITHNNAVNIASMKIHYSSMMNNEVWLIFKSTVTGLRELTGRELTSLEVIDDLFSVLRHLLLLLALCVFPSVTYYIFL